MMCDEELTITYNRELSAQCDSDAGWQEQDSNYSLVAILFIALFAYLFAGSVQWLMTLGGLSVALILIIFAGLMFLVYSYARERRLHTWRMRAIQAASLITASFQDNDAVISSAMGHIKEVELVARGYRL